jgi:hypothetical protein
MKKEVFIQKMTNEINLGSFKMPINSVTKTFSILAKRGAGKSYTGGVMAEEFYKNHIPFVVFDPIDVWWGLKLGADGKSKGLPIVVFGIDHADIKLDRDMGRKIAQAVVKYNISCVISTFGMPKVAQRHLIAEFSEEILNINNTPRHIFIEEAHEFVPQRVFGALGRTFNAVSNLVVMGRNRGIGVTLINQRASTINKDVLTQIDSLLAFRNVAPQDRKALKDWVEYHSAEGDFDKFMQSLPFLPTGEGWIWSPEFLGVFEKIKIRKRETFHPDREKLGENFVMPQLDQADVQEFITEFQKETKKSEPIKESKTNREIIEEKKENLEILNLKNECESKLLQKDLEIRKRDDLINQIRKLLGVSGNNEAIAHIPSSNLGLWLEKLGNSMPSKILKFVAEKSGLKFTRSQIALATGYSSKGGSFINAISLLKRNKLILQEGGDLQINPDL